MNDDTTRPKLTRHRLMHVNGGAEYSERVDAILADGEPTGITLYVQTDGRPTHHVVVRELRCGEETLDLLADDRPDPEAWIYEHLEQGTGDDDHD